MLTLILTFVLSAATPEAAPPVQATVTAKPAKPKLVCRANKSTGSRLKSRICKTQDEWDGEQTGVQNEARLRSVSGN